MNTLKTFMLGAAVSVAPVVASAATLDFTTESFSTFGTFDGVSYTITSDPADMITFMQGQDGNTCAILDCTKDGLGVGDDEISNNGITQSITIAFSQTVEIAGLYFLDLFNAPEDDTHETATVTTNDGSEFSFDSLETFDGVVSGFAYYSGLSIVGSSFTFTSSNTNDNIGVADFALAGLDVAPVPLPAGLLLLGGALGGLGFARRRKDKA